MLSDKLRFEISSQLTIYYMNMKSEGDHHNEKNVFKILKYLKPLKPFESKLEWN